MSSANDICSLDYLIGTLSTAYKGVITSLAAKDFCMTESGEAMILKGTVLSMPAGSYEASLIEKGIELARTALEDGYFELRAEARRVKQAKDLQIDLIQTGRHIGTFLLKKEAGGEFYMSAVELSGELKGMDLKLLTAPLHDKVGLLRKAEDIISLILSTKKDWTALSEKLNILSDDFFWSSRDGFYNAFPILCRYLFKAAERAERGNSGKAVGNALAIIENVLRHENDQDALRRSVHLWLKESESSSIDLSIHLKGAAELLKDMHDRFPDLNSAPAVIRLINSLKNKLLSLPLLKNDLLRLVQEYEPGAYPLFRWYGIDGRTGLSRKLSEAEEAVQQGALGSVFDSLESVRPEYLDDARMMTRFHELILTNLSPGTAEVFFEAWKNMLPLMPRLSYRAGDVAKNGLPAFIQKLVSFGMYNLTVQLIEVISSLASTLREDILLNVSTAGGVLQSRDEQLIKAYTMVATRIIVPAPLVREISTETWAEVANPGHLDRLTKFMDILQLGNGAFRPLLVHLIANLFISGVFIPDDKLFQRRISAYLNSSAMEDSFMLNFLFLQILPVYYHEVGAVSRIRDYSTEIDAWANDSVLYFLRKQVHVNASNYNVRLIEKIMAAWVFNDASLIRDAVPPDVYATINPALFAKYSAVAVPFLKSLGVLDEKGMHFEKLLNLEESVFPLKRARNGQVEEIPGKVMLLCRLYKEVSDKYSLDAGERSATPPDEAIAGYLESLQHDARTFLNRERTEARESLYFKRHIAFGIPSVLGTYHEPKFDAFRDFLRQGGRARIALERAIASITEAPVSRDDSSARAWLRVLSCSYDVLKLHGLHNMQIEEFSSILQQDELTFSQKADLFKMWEKELAWTVDLISRTFARPLADLLEQVPDEELPEQLQNLDRSRPDYVHKAVDVMLRDILASVPGLMESDRMVQKLLNVFSVMGEQTGEAAARPAHPDHIDLFDLGRLSDTDASRLGPVLGAKAKNLIHLHNKGFNVPCGITLSAKFPRDPRTVINNGVLSAGIKKAVQNLEARTGRAFGGPKKPLFLSVRSGSYVSMPGILSTILYCGMNSRTVHELLEETGDRFLAFDSYRRFIEQYSAIVLGLESKILDGIRKDLMSGESDDEGVVAAYLRELERRGLAIPEDVNLQLREAVSAIYASWFGRRAMQFRAATKTSDDWGTSVTLMAMVSGNSIGSGSSVFFTRNPFSGEEDIYGETREAATGDDLVFGRHMNRLFSRMQAAAAAGGRSQARESLEESDPELFLQHKELARSIENAMGGLPQEVEVAYTRQADGRRKLFVLQTRRMEFARGASARFDEICDMESRIIGRGMGGFGGALSGVASFAQLPEQAVRLRRQTGMPVILLRTTASTDDVSLMPEIGGMITHAGGVTSHAAVLAQKFGLNAVLGCQTLSFGLDQQGKLFARIGETILHEGTEISIDGATGLVFSGTCFSIGKIMR